MTRDELFKLHETTCAEALITMRKKNADYASSNDPFQNFNGSEQFGIHRVMGLVLRIGDKLQRINSFIQKSKLEVTNEGWADAIQDIINYAILAKGMLIDEQRSKDKGAEEINVRTTSTQAEADRHVEQAAEVERRYRESMKREGEEDKKVTQPKPYPDYYNRSQPDWTYTMPITSR